MLKNILRVMARNRYRQDSIKTPLLPRQENLFISAHPLNKRLFYLEMCLAFKICYIHFYFHRSERSVSVPLFHTKVKCIAGERHLVFLRFFCVCLLQFWVKTSRQLRKVKALSCWNLVQLQVGWIPDINIFFQNLHFGPVGPFLP